MDLLYTYNIAVINFHDLLLKMIFLTTPTLIHSRLSYCKRVDSCKYSRGNFERGENHLISQNETTERACDIKPKRDGQTMGTGWERNKDAPRLQ